MHYEPEPEYLQNLNLKFIDWWIEIWDGNF